MNAPASPATIDANPIVANRLIAIRAVIGFAIADNTRPMFNTIVIIGNNSATAILSRLSIKPTPPTAKNTGNATAGTNIPHVRSTSGTLIPSDKIPPTKSSMKIISNATHGSITTGADAINELRKKIPESNNIKRFAIVNTMNAGILNSGIDVNRIPNLNKSIFSNARSEAIGAANNANAVIALFSQLSGFNQFVNDPINVPIVIGIMIRLNAQYSTGSVTIVYINTMNAFKSSNGSVVRTKNADPKNHNNV